MAQHDYVIANGTGAAVRSDLNNALAAIVSQNSGATAPATTYAYQFWADTTTNLLKLRNSANSAWITLFQLDGEWSTLPVENGTAAAPSIYFKDSGTDTGFYSPGTDQVGISTGGTARLTIDANGNVAVDTNTLYVDAANNRVAIGNSSPNSYNASASDVVVGNHTGAHGVTICSQNNSSGYIMFADGTTGAQTYAGQITYDHTNNRLTLGTNDGTTGLTVDSSQRVGIGTTPSTLLHIQSTDPSFRFKRSDAGTDAYGELTTDTGGFVTMKCDPANAAAGSGFRITVDNSEALRVDSSSRLLLGTSTSALERLVIKADGGGIQINRNETGNPTSGQALGSIGFKGIVSANSNAAAEVLIQAAADEAHSGSTAGSRLEFHTKPSGTGPGSSPTERARITNGGFFKATNDGSYTGLTDSEHSFRNNAAGNWIQRIVHSASSSQYGITIQYTGGAPNNTTNQFLECQDTGGTRAVIRSNGGLANYSANNANLSDRNAKKDISPAAGTWDCIKEWEIVNYRYKDQPDDADLNLGVIAQQVAESCPEVITVFQEATEDQPEKLGIKEQQMYWMAIKALQEAQVRIEALEAEVAALKAS